MSLAEVIRYSSNIGIVEFGSRLSLREKYETLRDIGFGMATGIPLPGESDGVLREPSRWSAQSSASLMMGYEIAVTPLQLAAAYASLANGGVLLQPHIIKEIRSADGAVIYESRPRVLRRVFSENVASQVRELLRSVVDSGTAVKADLAAFEVAGKSGTARRTEKGKGYVAGSYTASFVGLFPAEKPQYVVLVKLDSPQRSIYGGEVAAPVTSVILRTALAARDAALDRGALASVEHDIPLPSPEKKSERRVTEADPITDTVDLPPPAAEPVAAPARQFSLPYRKKPEAADRSLRAVPDVGGLPLRSAVRALHRAGFRVTLAASLAAPTDPAAGTLLAPGTTVRLQHIP
jgi:cell division protein FtsI (penicillin-binding protein 3)